MHFTMDALCDDPVELNNEELIGSFLTDCAEAVGMTIISGPHVQLTKAGVTGVVLIAESHISVHVYNGEKRVFADIFSCKGFDPAPAVQLFKDRMGVGRIQAIKIPRGLEYPAPAPVPG